MGGISSREASDLNDEDKFIGTLDEKQIDCVILGRSRVGKTTLFHQMTGTPISSLHIATIGFETKEIDLDHCHIRLWDTSGIHDTTISTIHKYVIQRSDVLILVYALDDRRSWLLINDFYDELVSQTLMKTTAKIIVIGLDHGSGIAVSADEIRQFLDRISNNNTSHTFRISDIVSCAYSVLEDIIS